ncbi:MAG: LPS-assembly protein LptD [Rhodospirillales bacterium]|nr:LPS-assembly protein LptD [Rhodospirillales bacterium]
MELTADKLVYEQDGNVVTATGNVEIIQSDYVLIADKVIYHQEADKVVATGNVSMLNPNGDVIFADHAELTDRMREGFIKSIRLLLSDQSRMAAFEGRRTFGTVTELRKVVYSPCHVCDDKPGRSPLWQIKAQKVVHDQESKRISYHHAIFELWGLPVAYTPYFSHPDPSIKRKSGFLAPTFGRSSDLGVMFGLPYYYAISSHRDMTIAPSIMSREGPLVSAEYRERTRTGKFEFSGSITRVDDRDLNGDETGRGKETRGHVFGNGSFEFGHDDRWGFDLAATSDDTYLRRFKISSEDTLTSRIFVEGLRGRTHASANAYYFRGLKEDEVSSETPIIFPVLDYNFIGEPDRFGGRFNIDANALVLQRREGADSRRASVAGGWQLPYVAPHGSVFTFAASVRGDIYHTNGVPNQADPTSAKRGGVIGRVLPQVSLDWRFPLVRTEGGARQMIEPIVVLVASPYGGNPSSIPNEDSESFEFDDTNLFSPNRFTGLDRWEGGPRANVGVKLAAYGQSGAQASFLLGQSFRLRENTLFRQETGLEKKRSDFVGRFYYRPSKYLDYIHRFRLNRSNFGFRRNDIQVLVGPPYLKFKVNYVELDEALTDDQIKTVQELNASLTLRMTEFWSLKAHNRRDIETNQTISSGVGVLFKNECVEFNASFDRRFTRDRDVEPSSSFNFSLILTNIG